MPVPAVSDHKLPPLAQADRAVLASVGFSLWTLLALLASSASSSTSFTSSEPRNFRQVHIHVNLPMRTIAFYQTSNGRAPALDFIDSLSDKERKKIYWVLNIVQESDMVPAQYLQKLADTAGLWEVRTEYAGQAFRVLGFFDGPLLVVLTNAFSKKTAHTPLSEIEVAHQRRRDYLMRKGKK